MRKVTVDMMRDRRTAPSPHRLGVDDNYKMAEAGILKPEGRVELIDGEIIDMAPIGSRHGGTTNSLIDVFGRAAADRLVTLSV